MSTKAINKFKELCIQNHYRRINKETIDQMIELLFDGTTDDEQLLIIRSNPSYALSYCIINNNDITIEELAGKYLPEELDFKNVILLQAWSNFVLKQLNYMKKYANNQEFYNTIETWNIKNINVNLSVFKDYKIEGVTWEKINSNEENTIYKGAAVIIAVAIADQYYQTGKKIPWKFVLECSDCSGYNESNLSYSDKLERITKVRMEYAEDLKTYYNNLKNVTIQR